MEISYKRNHSESFMIVKLQALNKGYEERMVVENNISSLLPFNVICVNGENNYWYNISKKESLSDYLECEDIDVSMLEKLVMQMNLAFEELERYLIDAEHILLTIDTVYIDRSRGGFKIMLCFYPMENGSLQKQFRGILENIIRMSKSENPHVNEVLYGLYEMSLKDDYTLLEMMEYIDDMTEEPYKKEPQEKATCEEERNRDELAPIKEDDAIAVAAEKISLEDYFEEEPQNKLLNAANGLLGKIIKKRDKLRNQSYVNMEDFVVEPDYEINEPTILLKEGDIKCSGRLVYDGLDGEDDYALNSGIFRIGTDRDKNDACLKSKAVSHHHAKIVREGDDFYLEDLNSTNGTFINDKMLEYKEKYKLNIMDRIRFADVSFVFH